MESLALQHGTHSFPRVRFFMPNRELLLYEESISQNKVPLSDCYDIF